MKRVVMTLIHSDGKFATLAELETEAVETALLYYRSRVKAAKALGIGLKKLYHKMEIYGLNDLLPPGPPGPGKKKIKQ